MSQEGNTQGPKFLGRTPTEWLLSLPIFSLLLLTLVIGTGEYFHGQLLRMGENMFGNQAQGVQYFMLRADPEKPDCDANPDIEAAITMELMNKSGGGDAIDALFADEAKDPEAIRASLLKAAELCKEKHVMYEKIVENLTPTVKAYRAVETSFFGIFRFGTENRPLLLLLMVMLASIHTTLGEHHIALRPPKTRVDFRIYSITMTAANALLTFSSVKYLQMQINSGIPVDKPWLYYLWISMFSILTLISFKQVIFMPKRAEAGGTVGMALLSIPLYAWMSLIGGSYFLGQQHWSAQAIYLNQMVELSGIFLNLALFIWAGMLLKQTQMVDRFLDLLRPWKMSPEMLTYIILLGAALPTAYTGASGIFVIAAGALIYHEVRHAGGSRQFALAASAMSGSLGVVLRPCLLIVLIAALNKQVTTQQLYGWGVAVFFLTSTLFLVAAQMSRTKKVKLENPSVAFPAMIRNIGPVIPYMVVFLVVVLFYKYALNTKLDEFTAPVIMPIIMLFLLIFDRLRKNRKPDETEEEVGPSAAVPGRGFKALEGSIRFATNETIAHIGALILLMALSLSMGGVVERSGIMETFPHQFPNIWIAMALFVGIMVFLGMVMDPFGAVILVSATLAPIAYNNGIDPVHFWMMVLVAFELGYLTPPVALNQLLLRQVVGEEETAKAGEEVKHLGFYRRYERWILPCLVMGAGLLIVAFGPLIAKAWS
ncbi:MAG: transporter [Moraxellaceae bacterium]|jgi:TRAP-type C4-dicarboxylate transport system permease large subunit|nr:transporter [Moraxellaceae bacterium]